MKRCYGCFEQIADDQTRCPVCGYVEGTSTGDSVFLIPGTVLSGRYTLGTVLENDDTAVTYAAWDDASSVKVKIKEFLPVKYVTRIPGSTFVVPFDKNRDALFDNGFKAFVNEANRIYEQGGDEKLYDCIGENNTAYMIFEWTENKKASPFMPAARQTPFSQPAPAPASVQPVITEEPFKAAPVMESTVQSQPAGNSAFRAAPVSNTTSGDTVRYQPRISEAPVPAPQTKSDNNGFMRKIALLPMWIKILAPVVLVAAIAVPIIIATVSSKTGKNPSRRSGDTVTETAAETTETTAETTETTPVSETTETTLPPTGWQGNDYSGWRYFPEAGTYYQDSWEEIGGEWYYFNSDGIMEKGCYRDGYWIGYDGIRAYDSPGGEWKEDDTGSWYEDSGWYPSDMGLWIDGEYYWFDSDGYWDPSITGPEEVVRESDDEEDDEDDDEDEEGDYGE